jgi:hypothetical protein
VNKDDPTAEEQAVIAEKQAALLAKFSQARLK